MIYVFVVQNYEASFICFKIKSVSLKKIDR